MKKIQEKSKTNQSQNHGAKNLKLVFWDTCNLLIVYLGQISNSLHDDMSHYQDTVTLVWIIMFNNQGIIMQSFFYISYSHVSTALTWQLLFQNTGTGTSSSLSLLKKRLASLGPKMKPESMESPVKGANIDKLESKNVPSPALVMKKGDENISPNVLLNESKESKNNRSFDEDGVTTPNAE